MAGFEWEREERRDRGGRDKGERKSCAKLIMHLERERCWFWKKDQRVNEEREMKRN
jgi:hypothetical protein